jgi:polysaccharide deacetylase family protein (PEP-CTERM system associated)
VSATQILNALSVDVEEYFQVSAFERHIARADWDHWPTRVAWATERLLDVFGEVGARATFFTLGWVAERHRGLIQRIVREGHELGCHGYEHIRITNQSRQEFRADLARSKSLLEDAAGTAVHGYRAATFSITRENLWAFQEIEQAGFRYSSSVYPVHHDLYGIPDAPRRPFRPVGTSRLVEIPVSTLALGKFNLPVAGGGYFRLLPYAVSRALVRRVHAHEDIPVNMYFHPWEFDPDQPRPPGLTLKTRVRHYINQGRTLSRMRALVRDFAWDSFANVYAEAIAGHELTDARSDLVAT